MLDLLTREFAAEIALGGGGGKPGGGGGGWRSPAGQGNEPAGTAWDVGALSARSSNRARRFILIGSAEQIELHPCNVVPAVVLPFDAAV